MTTPPRFEAPSLARPEPTGSADVPSTSDPVVAAGTTPSQQFTARSPRRRGGPLQRLKGLWRLWFFALVLVLWWVLSADSTSTFFPPLQNIVQRLWETWVVGEARSDLYSSLRHFAIGYTIAGVLGVAIGALLWKFQRVGHAVSPVLYFVYVIPTAALLPAIVAIMGIGSPMKITIVVLAAVWPTMLNTLDGMRGIDPIKLDTAKVLHMSPLTTVRSVVLPGAMPQIMAGLRHSLSIAVIMMVVSELIASTEGIGFFILEAQQRFAITTMWTGIIVLALVGSALTFLFIAVERVVLGWYIGARAVEQKG
ncbi:ABC transporter permease [Modestobacter sp. VKM Ac-2986]|uniref:ABC transporter permease n=1 Tax=Modestobacter sp. VKM Ac-2986 TaxID=3004140 RepID=UPI0022AA6F7B|nr:ABC transporter permease [Modestobacter sp. VKM Ac-2986]MCZ2827566.1 ABC transporter permease [Modestobacter sp. VKM Ac-2986]